MKIKNLLFMTAFISVLLFTANSPAGEQEESMARKMAVIEYDTPYTHQYLAQWGFSLLDRSCFLPGEFKDRSNLLMRAAVAEDSQDFSNDYDDWDMGSTLNHGFDPDAGPDSSSWPGLYPGYPGYPSNAWMHAMEWFDTALIYHMDLLTDDAYSSLGRVAHLACDASTPAHAHNFPHLPPGDALEKWLEVWQTPENPSPRILCYLPTPTSKCYPFFSDDSLRHVAGLNNLTDDIHEIIPEDYISRFSEDIPTSGWEQKLFCVFFEAAERVQSFHAEIRGTPDTKNPAERDNAGLVDFTNWNADPQGDLSEDNESYTTEDEARCFQQAQCTIPTAIKATALVYRLFLEKRGLIFTLSGMISGDAKEGITVTVVATDNLKVSVVTDSSGNYNVGAMNGTYSVTPSKPGYTFTPSSRTVTISGANQAEVNFTATEVGGCTTWNDVISKYNLYVSGQAQWIDVINCYNQYATP